MNSKITPIAAGALVALLALPAFAQNVLPAPPSVVGNADVTAGASAGGTTVSASVQARITTGKNRADQEIARCINALNELNTNVQLMVKVSAEEKSAISNEASSEVSALTTLQAKIDADTDLPTLKADIKSITDSYRIFLLILPQGRIEVAADKIETVADTFTTFAGKLQTRIATAQASGSDVTSLSASFSDMNANISDANTQASASASEVATLMPDNGNTTVAQSNAQALKDAHSKIQTALKDLQKARQDAGVIVRGLETLDASASSTTSVSGSAQ